MAIKYIGNGGGFDVTADYSSIQSWANYVSALGTLSENETGRVLWMSAGNELSASSISFPSAAVTTGAFQMILEAGDRSGSAKGSFRDHISATNNALRYNPAVGACVIFSSGVDGMSIPCPNVTIRNLQFAARASFGTIMLHNVDDSAITVDSCIFKITSTSNKAFFLIWDGLIKNCLFYSNATVQSGQTYYLGNAVTTRLYNCTVAHTGSAGTKIAIDTTFPASSMLNNVAIYGFNRDCTAMASASAVASAVGIATSLSTASSSISTVFGGIYNLAGTDFVSVTSGSEDFRLSSASASLVGAGSSASGVLTTDIIGQTRS